jgi:hypothetical protein
MAATRRNLVTVDISGNQANIAAIETLFATAISGLTANFLPEHMVENRNEYSNGSQVEGVLLQTAKGTAQAFNGVTTAVVKALSLAGRANAAAVDSAFTTINDAQETAGRTLRCACIVRVIIAGVATDVLLLLYTDGTSPVVQVGTSVAMTAGSVTISGVVLTANSKIFLTANTAGGTQGTLRAPTATRNVGAGTFVINSSSGTDTSTVDWMIVG